MTFHHRQEVRLSKAVHPLLHRLAAEKRQIRKLVQHPRATEIGENRSNGVGRPWKIRTATAKVCGDQDRKHESENEHACIRADEESEVNLARIEGDPSECDDQRVRQGRDDCYKPYVEMSPWHSVKKCRDGIESALNKDTGPGWSLSVVQLSKRLYDAYLCQEDFSAAMLKQPMK